MIKKIFSFLDGNACGGHPCLFGCTPSQGGNYVCGCPPGYEPMGQGYDTYFIPFCIGLCGALKIHKHNFFILSYWTNILTFLHYIVICCLYKPTTLLCFDRHCISTASSASTKYPPGVQLPHEDTPSSGGKLPPGEGCYQCDHDFGEIPLSRRTRRSTSRYKKNLSNSKFLLLVLQESVRNLVLYTTFT